MRNETKYLAATLALAVVLAGVITAGIWTGRTTLDPAGLTPVAAIPGTLFVFALVFWTARGEDPEIPNVLPNNLLPFWIRAALVVAGIEFTLWFLSKPLLLRDLLMVWIIIAAVAIRVIQYRGFGLKQPRP